MTKSEKIKQTLQKTRERRKSQVCKVVPFLYCFYNS